MMVIFRILCGVLALIPLVPYSIISSFILFFIPRVLRKKKNITGQRVLITGAGNGVGRELAIEFSKHATCLIMVDINKQSLLETEKLLDRSSSAFLYDCDVSDYKKVYEMAKRVHKDAGHVDILVNNAGIVNGENFLDLKEEKIIKTLEVNALAHFWTCKAFLPSMIKKNSGHIVSIISLLSKSGMPKLTDYCASKYAALGFAESLDMELHMNKIKGIKITTVLPSAIDTNLFKGTKMTIGSTLTPEYVAKEVVAGVLENEEMIILPHHFHFFVRIKEILPRWIAIRMEEASGVTMLMDNFAGRKTLENATDVQNKAIKSE